MLLSYELLMACRLSFSGGLMVVSRMAGSNRNSPGNALNSPNDYP